MLEALLHFSIKNRWLIVVLTAVVAAVGLFQLQRLPINRSAEAIALLAPGAVAGAGGFAALSGLVSFGGSGVSENAYYINASFEFRVDAGQDSALLI